MTNSSQLPDPQLEKLALLLMNKINDGCGLMKADSCRWQEVFDASASALFDAHVREIGAHQGTVWLLDADRETLVPAYNNGPNARDFVGRFHEPLTRGIVSTVFATQMGICESRVYLNAQHDSAANHFRTTAARMTTTARIAREGR